MPTTCFKCEQSEFKEFEVGAGREEKKEGAGWPASHSCTT